MMIILKIKVTKAIVAAMTVVVKVVSVEVARKKEIIATVTPFEATVIPVDVTIEKMDTTPVLYLHIAATPKVRNTVSITVPDLRQQNLVIEMQGIQEMREMTVVETFVIKKT